MISNRYILSHVDRRHLRFINDKSMDTYLDIPLDLYCNWGTFSIDTYNYYDINMQLIDPDTSINQLDMRYISPINNVEYQVEDINSPFLNVLVKLGIYRIPTYILVHLQSGISIKLNKRDIPDKDIDKLVTGMILKIELK